MSEFLAGDDLTKKIREVVGGNNVKCAVAYWGQHKLFEGGAPEDVQIVCDIHSGMTSEKVLRGLGAPENDKIRYHNGSQGLHAKVYISDQGVVVGSANASSGGLEYLGKPARLLEAGVFAPFKSDAWSSAVEWFDELFRAAHRVDETALRLAKRLFRPRSKSIGGEGTPFLRQVAETPEVFERGNICFVLSVSGVNNEEFRARVGEAIEERILPSQGAQDAIKWPDAGRFMGWDEGDFEELSPNIVSIYAGSRGKVRFSKHILAISCVDIGIFLTNPAARDHAIFSEVPNEISENEMNLIREIRGYGEMGRVVSPRRFSEILQRYYSRDE